METEIKIKLGCEAGSEHCRGCKMLYQKSTSSYYCMIWDYPDLKETPAEILRCKQCLDAEEEMKK